MRGQAAEEGIKLDQRYFLVEIVQWRLFWSLASISPFQAWSRIEVPEIKPFPMKSLIACFSLLAFAACPAFAENTTGVTMPALVQISAPLQVTIIKRDARENVIAVQQVDLAKAIALASQLVPGALSGNASDAKSLTITYK